MFPSRKLVLLVLLLSLPGCALPAYLAYVPSSPGAICGYAQAPVAPDIIEVGFVGPSRFDPATNHQFATFRAAELTLQAGKPCFAILTERTNSGRLVSSVAVTTTDADGNTSITWETETDYYPIDTLLIRTLDTPRSGDVDAAEVLHLARKLGVRLAPETLARLAALPP